MRRLLRSCGSVVEAEQLAEKLIEAGYPVTVLGSTSSSAYFGVNQDREVWIEDATLLEDPLCVEEIADIVSQSRRELVEETDTSYGSPLEEPDDPYFGRVILVVIAVIVLSLAVAFYRHWVHKEETGIERNYTPIRITGDLPQ